MDKKTKNMNKKSANKFIISGGGTGGHIFPAISIANALKERYPEAEFLFVGALGRMEMERIPQAGYKIVGLPVQGFDRKNMLKNIKVLFNLFKSTRQARKIIQDFKPDIAIGVGGYASAPTLKSASEFGVPTLLQEQNSYAGVTNKLLARKAACICVAYEGMERFFPKEKIVLTGNPVRQDLVAVAPKSAEAYEFFGLNPQKKTLLIVGGSLGARTINQSIIAHLKTLNEADIQVVWQTGKFYIDDARRAIDAVISDFKSEKTESDEKNGKIIVTDFVSRMDYAYSVADLVISRAGASSISELCLLEKPVILVPSPNVAEDHQTQNALALVRKNAAILIKDADAKEQLVPEALKLIQDDEKLNDLSRNIVNLAQKNSASRIVDEVVKLINPKMSPF